MNSNEIQGRYLKNLIHYIIPPAYANAGNSFIIMIVSVWISQWIGSNALGAVNIVAPFLSFVFAYGLIFGAGGGTIAAAYFAKGENEKADGAFTISLLMLTVTMLFFTIAAYLNLHSLSSLMGATTENFHLVKEYFAYICIFSVFFPLTFAMNVFIRFEGYPSKAFLGSTINFVSILIFSFLFIKVFSLGIKGAALGLIASRIVVTLYYLRHFLRPHKGFRFKFKNKGIPGDAKRVFMIGIPNALSEASSGIFILIFNYLAVFWLGNNGLIIFAVICTLYQFIVQLMLGIAQGLQPIVSWHNAREEKSLSYKYLRYTMGITAVLSVGITLAGFLFSNWITGKYISAETPMLFTQTVSAIKVFIWFAMAVGFNIVFVSYFSAADRAKWSMILSWGRSLVVISAAGLLLPHIMGSDGIWFAPVASELIILALATYYCIKSRIFKELLPIKLRTRFAGI